MSNTSTTKSTLPSIEASVCVSLGSTSAQGWALNGYGELEFLFGDELSPENVSIKTLQNSKETVKHLFDYLMLMVQTNKKVIFFNSIGYSIDGGKKKGDEVGPAYSYVEDVKNFQNLELVGIMAEVVQENPAMSERFVVINRNYKTSDGEEIAGQWAKQIQQYLEENDTPGMEWVIDLGGKSGTLYHYEEGIYKKRETIFSDPSPNSVIMNPDEFSKSLKIELDKLKTAGIDLSKVAILQTGMARDKNTVEIFSKEVAFHKFITQQDEGKYEAIDFSKTVLKALDVSSFTLSPKEGQKMVVKSHIARGFFGRILEQILYTIWY